jgi:hypothetical protein
MYINHEHNGIVTRMKLVYLERNFATVYDKSQYFKDGIIYGNKAVYEKVTMLSDETMLGYYTSPANFAKEFPSSQDSSDSGFAGFDPEDMRRKAMEDASENKCK